MWSTSKIQILPNTILLGAISFFITSISVFSQSTDTFKQYKGSIVDEVSKKPLVFATITLDGTNISTITNTEGKFLLKIPEDVQSGTVDFSFLGYQSKKIALADLQADKNKITLLISVTELANVDVNAPKDAAALVRETLERKGENYFNDPTLMTAFYRETIKKRKRNVSLSEAVVNIYKTPYDSNRKDVVELYKARKSTDYKRLDTVALKLQGGPFNALYVDVMKYPEYIFNNGSLAKYNFRFSRSTRIKNKLIYVITFNQKDNILDPLYRGELFIDVEDKILTSATYQLNITNKELAAELFVRKKPKDVEVWPNEIAYRVDYREKDGRWYYGYSNAILEFKVDWKGKLFNSTYTLSAEMAVTDWEKNLSGNTPRGRDRLKKSIILSDEAIGFSDPDFWGQYNIIEPEKSIESAIKKIQRQLKRGKSKTGNSIP